MTHNEPIVIEIRGGSAIKAYHENHPDIDLIENDEVIIRDLDNIKEGDPDPLEPRGGN